MSLTAKDLALRKTGITATDIVTLATAGDGGYGSPLEVFLSKVTDAPGWAGSMRTEMGHAAEPVIMKALATKYGLTLVPSPTLRSRIVPYFLATPDRLAVDGAGIPIATCEGKLVGWRMTKRWYDEEGNAVFPDEVGIQVCWQAGVSRSAEGFDRSRVDRGYIGALLGDFGEEAFHDTVMPWEGAVEDLWLGLCELGQRFWVDHVLAGVPPTPDGSERAREALEKMYPAIRRPVLAAATPEVSALMADLVETRDAKGALELKQQALANQLRAAVGAAGVEGMRDDAFKVTWKPQAGRVSAEKIAARLGATPADLDACRGEPSRKLLVNPLSLKEMTHASTVQRLLAAE